MNRGICPKPIWQSLGHFSRSRSQAFHPSRQRFQSPGTRMPRRPSVTKVLWAAIVIRGCFPRSPLAANSARATGRRNVRRSDLKPTRTASGSSWLEQAWTFADPPVNPPGIEGCLLLPNSDSRPSRPQLKAVWKTRSRTLFPIDRNFLSLARERSGLASRHLNPPLGLGPEIRAASGMPPDQGRAFKSMVQGVPGRHLTAPASAETALPGSSGRFQADPPAFVLTSIPFCSQLCAPSN